MNKYEIAIMRFSCDFQLELENNKEFSISEQIKKGNKELLNDINTIIELDFMIRNGRVDIKVYE